MKRTIIIGRLLIAVFFGFVLRAGYSLTKETTGQIIGQKLITPVIYDWMALLPKDHYSPWHDVAGLSTIFLAVIPTALLCGLLFAYVFRERTLLWSIVPASTLIAYFLTSLRNHMYHWTVYFEYAFLLIAFSFFSTVGARYYRAPNAGAVANKNLRRYSIASAMIIATVFLGWLHFYYPLLGTLVKGENFEGIILKKEFGYDPAEWWPVQEEDIKALESHLGMYVSSHQNMLSPRMVNELASYRRWYSSQMSKRGERQIHVFLMHRSQVSRSEWLHVFFGVLGGGDSYYYMTYNVRDGTFENVFRNSEV